MNTKGKITKYSNIWLLHCVVACRDGTKKTMAKETVLNTNPTNGTKLHYWSVFHWHTLMVEGGWEGASFHWKNALYESLSIFNFNVIKYQPLSSCFCKTQDDKKEKNINKILC